MTYTPATNRYEELKYRRLGQSGLDATLRSAKLVSVDLGASLIALRQYFYLGVSRFGAHQLRTTSGS